MPILRRSDIPIFTSFHRQEPSSLESRLFKFRWCEYGHQCEHVHYKSTHDVLIHLISAGWCCCAVGPKMTYQLLSTSVRDPVKDYCSANTAPKTFPPCLVDHNHEKTCFQWGTAPVATKKTCVQLCGSLLHKQLVEPSSLLSNDSKPFFLPCFPRVPL